MTTTLKTCFKCDKTLELSEFYRHSQMKDGHLNKCKPCAKADAHESRHSKHRDRVLQYDRERAKRPERMAAQAVITERWLREHPERRAAQVALGNAVRSGRVVPLPCFACGAITTEAHHPDYSAPLNVVWLCVAHHRQTHALKSMQDCNV